MANTMLLSFAILLQHYLNLVQCLFDPKAQNNLAVYWGKRSHDALLAEGWHADVVIAKVKTP